MEEPREERDESDPEADRLASELSSDEEDEDEDEDDAAYNAEIDELRQRYKNWHIATHTTSLIPPDQPNYTHLRRTLADDVRFDGVLAIVPHAEPIPLPIALPTLVDCPYPHPMGVFMIAMRGENLPNISAYPRNANKAYASRVLCDLAVVMKDCTHLFFIHKIEETRYSSQIHIVVASREETVNWCRFQQDKREVSQITELDMMSNEFLVFVENDRWTVLDNHHTLNLFVDHEISLAPNVAINYKNGLHEENVLLGGVHNALLQWSRVKTWPYYHFELSMEETRNGGIYDIVEVVVKDVNSFEETIYAQFHYFGCVNLYNFEKDGGGDVTFEVDPEEDLFVMQTVHDNHRYAEIVDPQHEFERIAGQLKSVFPRFMNAEHGKTVTKFYFDIMWNTEAYSASDDSSRSSGSD